MARINEFLNRHLSMENKLRWVPLDNAAKIYPAARSQKWSNVFRLSATLTENVDREILQSALDVTVRRFPAMAVRLRRGFFWYYLEQLKEAPKIRQEHSYPLTRMSRQETRRCAFRVIVHGKRIALDIFHSLTDGNGGLIFLKTILAEYLYQKYGLRMVCWAVWRHRHGRRWRTASSNMPVPWLQAGRPPMPTGWTAPGNRRIFSM